MTRHEIPIELTFSSNALCALEELNVLLSLQIRPVECIHYFNEVTEFIVLWTVYHYLWYAGDVISVIGHGFTQRL
jgi:hypothetical protein